MPHTKRFQPPCSMHHIMAHSIEGKDMFLDDEDRQEFIRRLEKGLKKTGFICITWALLDNHYHLFIKTNDKKLEKLMRGLNGGYAQYYNRKYGKRGCLFQGRFKSVLCQDKKYAAQLIKYINLNPLRAGKVRSIEVLKHYTWCGHGFMLGQRSTSAERFQNRQWCLSRFGMSEQEAIETYMKIVLKDYDEKSPELAGKLPPAESNEIENSCKGEPAMIGEPEWATTIFDQYCDEKKRRHRKADYPKVIKGVRQEMCDKHGIATHEIFKRGWNNSRSRARTEFCYHLNKTELIPPMAIARYLRISVSAVLRMIDIGDVLCREKNRAGCSIPGVP